MGRQRHPKRRDWPPGLYERRDGDRVHYTFRYVDKASGKRRERCLKSNLQEAKNAARQILQSVSPDPVKELVARVLAPAHPFSEHLDWYLANIVASQSNIETRKENIRYLKGIGEYFGARSITALTRADIASFLNPQTPAVHAKNRTLLNQLMLKAVERGLREDNPVEKTGRKKYEKQRTRLSIEHFNAIRNLAEPWYVRVMDVAVYATHRRGDLVSAKLSQWASEKLRVVQSKTGNAVETTLGPKLRAALEACANAPERSDPKSPAYKSEYLLCAPDAPRVSRRRVTKMFARLRDRIPELAAMPKKSRPSFHELRALGSHLLEVEGSDEGNTQSVMGHDSLRMTKKYLAGHAGGRIHRGRSL